VRYESLDAFDLSSSGAKPKIRCVEAQENGELKEGSLVDPLTGMVVFVQKFIPRFVENDSYTANFGLQWNHFRRTQIDRFNGTAITYERFYAGTGWSQEEIRGQHILEVGMRSGSFHSGDVGCWCRGLGPRLQRCSRCMLV